MSLVDRIASNKDLFRNTEMRLKEVQDVMKGLDLKGEVDAHNAKEIKKRRDLQEEFWKTSSCNELLLRKKRQ